jgi:hypothetical protein
MRKLKLNLSDLKVTTFEPSRVVGSRGTLQGYVHPSADSRCPDCPFTQNDEQTCKYSCWDGTDCPPGFPFG